MPIVTLLKPSHADYTMIRGGSSIIFKGGVATEVPIPVALQAKNIKSRGDKLMFKVEDIPDLVLSDNAAQKKETKKTSSVEQTKLF